MTSPVWTPTPDGVAAAKIEDFRRWLARRDGVELPDYPALQAWSVSELEQFWGRLWEYFDIQAATAGDRVLTNDGMPGARWFPGATLNLVDQVFRHVGPDRPAIIDEAEPGGAAGRRIHWPELHRQVGAVAATLRSYGVEPGDRVVGYLPNIAEAVIAFLATASIGAVWSSCGQDYAASAAVDRLGQLDPVVLVTADGYRYGGRDHDRRDAVAHLRAHLPTLRATVVVPRLGLDLDLDGITTWEHASAGEQPLTPVPVAFDHPLWVLFSSGTTGKPKGIVHGHGGVLLEHLKQLRFHLDLGASDTYFWYTSPSWMMWNFQVAGLLVGATIVCYDGSPSHPGPDALWALAEQHDVTVLGTSPAYLQACEQAGLHPAVDHDLTSLRMLGATGSVLPPGSYAWVAREIGPHIPLASMTGGTDVVSAFAGAVPTVPIWAGELSAPCLGVALEAWDPRGISIRNQVGELVIRRPMPSMPVSFWDDADGERYRAAYFDTFPGVWRHGDWITISDRGTVVVHGRSDSTLNRNGVRMGSADIYQVVEPFPEITEALVIGAEQPDGSYWMPLFVVLAEGTTLTEALRTRIRTAIREGASPRHVPDEILAVPGIPHTRTGKKLEVPIKQLLQGGALTDVVESGSVDDADLLDVFLRIAREHETVAASAHRQSTTTATAPITPHTST